MLQNRKGRDNEVICAGSSNDGKRVQWFLVQSITVLLEKMKDKAGSWDTRELIDLLQQENFNL